ncbi:hypothetical protein Taro_016692 [Colocasia esculenta]|uniref:Uncharacterized protein n=1 Tax=Colocasia esculenta TaxID=4460 RepID=A0A843UP53_COLES|nr:hypothetical protein [Colocasia esculenta]
MGFLVTTLIFILAGFVASLCALICCNRGPSTNLWKGRNGDMLEQDEKEMVAIMSLTTLPLAAAVAAGTGTAFTHLPSPKMPSCSLSLLSFFFFPWLPVYISPDIDYHGSSLLLDDVGNCVPRPDEAIDCSHPQRRRVRRLIRE